VQDKTDGQINVVKKAFDQDAPPADLYDSIKIEAIAEMMAECFNQLNPPMKVHFMPCFLYILAQRPNQPTVRVEPLVFNHEKAKLRAIHDATTLERETLSAFELFTYHGSKKALVITNPCRIGDMWGEPEMHSVDRSLGGARNMGARGINVFLLRHEYSPIAAQIGLDNPSNLHAKLATEAVKHPSEWNPEQELGANAASRNLDYVKRKLRETGSLLPESLPGHVSGFLPEMERIDMGRALSSRGSNQWSPDQGRSVDGVAPEEEEEEEEVNPKPETRRPKPETRNPKPEVRSSNPET